MIGRTLAHYRIDAELGAGGMGVVYRARDTRLARDVALKLLRPALAADEERRRRFEREARTIAALDHPNIVSIHAIEQADGVCFIVMQLVRGKTLRELIPKGGLPLGRLFDVAVPLVRAVSAAHERGITHRDLKPTNVMVADEGLVKVLDFGLAKLREETGESATLFRLTTEPLTEAGQIVGTVAYMSPEQAEGRTVDHRSDILSLGVMLYEMASGTRTFKGDTPLSTLTSILRDTPAMGTRLNPGLPHHLGRIVRRSLEKDPRRRYQDAVDLGNELEDLKREIDSGELAGVEGTGASASRRAAGTTGRRWLLATAAAFLLAVGTFTGWLLPRSVALQDSPSRPPLVQRQLTANPMEIPVSGAAISPDGKLVAYTDQTGLYLQVVDTGETRPVPVPPGSRFWDVNWFPNGTQLLLTGPSSTSETIGLYTVPIVGGTPRKLQEDAWRAAVSPDGTSIAFLRASYPVREIWVMGAGGEQPHRILGAREAETFWQVGWSPDGRRVAFGSVVDGPVGYDASIEAVSLDGARRIVVLKDPLLRQSYRGTLPFCWLPDGRMFFARADEADSPSRRDTSNVWAARVDPAAGALSGSPGQLTYQAGFNIRDLRSTASGLRLSLLRDRQQPDVYVAPLTHDPPGLGTPRRPTFDDRWDYRPTWTHDSKAVFFTSLRGGTPEVFRQAFDERVAERVMAGGPVTDGPNLSPDGTWLLYWQGDRLMRAPLSGGPGEEVLRAGGASGHCSVPRAGARVLGEVREGFLTLFRLDPLKGRGAELARVDVKTRGFWNWALSADGSRAAVMDLSNRIRIVDLGSSSVRDLTVPGWTAFETIGWATDDDAVLTAGFWLKGPRLNNRAILHVDLQGGVVVLRHEENEWHEYPVVSPDGRFLAFTVARLDSNVWMFERF